MRAFACALAASAALLAGPVMAAPTRVVSLNLCTDELLLMLARPGQIASVTHLSQQPAESPLWRQARRHRRNDGSLLSVAALRPDLAITMGGGGDRAGIARRLGVPLLTLPFAQSLADVANSVGGVARALDREAEGARLIAELKELQRSAPPAAIDAVWLGGGGRSLAARGLGAEWMRLAGLRQRPLPGDRLTLEELLARPPALLLRSNYRNGQHSGEQRWLAHPLLKRPRRSRSLVTDGRRWTCMGPAMIGEVRRLREALRR